MAENTGNALTDAERAELEELRAEKARREAEEHARLERAELEALRAERGAVARGDAAPAAREAPAPASKSFGERMVTSADTDDDGIPTMPPAQKLIIAVCLLALVAFVIYNFVN